MSDRWYLDRSSRKLPPPEHGIKAKKPGQTWWGRRWIAALESVSDAYAHRLVRGRSYARAGRTHDLVVAPGHVRALATGSRAKPYEVELDLEVFSEPTWRSAIAAMAKRAQFAAELLAGQMPDAIDEAFATSGKSLFPSSETELHAQCSCPDWANPCKHIAATHYVLGEALDRDPFLLFELRGRTKKQVLEKLRSARREQQRSGRGKAGKKPATKARRARGRTAPETSKKPGRFTEAEYDVWRAPLPALELELATPAASGALLRQLGTPPGWSAAEQPADLFGRIVREASARALSIALGNEQGDTADSER
jgi:uncharacterized Zn finger protein